jgi:hypothetical protein
MIVFLALCFLLGIALGVWAGMCIGFLPLMVGGLVLLAIWVFVEICAQY